MAASHSVQSIQGSLTLPVPTLTSTANGTIETLTSPGCFAAFFKVVSRLWAASLRAVILPLDAIEPVLSSANAILSFLMPHITSAEAEKLSWLCPSSLVNTGSMLPLPVILSVKLPPLGRTHLLR
ncbi:MAG TPA: hypothetical protein VNQ74_17145, partial [Burkholderiaceae bacterium]|nr:hypothetical protein [Burkholderiaceae bacterium]